MKSYPYHAPTLKYCIGKGAELGRSSHNPFGLPDCINIAPCDGVNFMHPQDLEDYRTYAKEQARFGHPPTPVDKIGDFRHIPLDSESLDYIVSAHVIEHEPNPVAALIEVSRVLREEGIFSCIFPKRNAETARDIFRPLTQLEELIQAYEKDRKVTDSADGTNGADGTNSEIPSEWRPHYHVYSLQSMLRLVNWCNHQSLTNFLIEAVEETDSKVGNGHTIILRKLLPNAIKNADYLPLIEQCLARGDYEEALLAAKLCLSRNFFKPEILYAAAILSYKLEDISGAREFFRQSLIQTPESEPWRREFHELFNEFYQNPLP